ncbi:MAG TPA: urease subunit beta [Nitrososphaeraceae archaeon]|nr:urease subunit beta [Nitrososphaeraceae archaeon]
MIPGEYFLSKSPILANVGKKTIKINVKNTGDRPIQVGSHTHFFETNKYLSFQRNKTFGFHLNIPSGTSLRFEPGDSRIVELTEYGGKKIVFGFNSLVNGKLTSKQKEISLLKLKKMGFMEEE